MTHERAGRARRTGRMPPALSRGRRIAGFLIALLGLPASTALLRGPWSVSLTSDILLFLAAVVGIALVGGLWPALFAAVAGSLLLNWYFVPPIGRFTIAEADNFLALAIFVVIALAVSWVVDQAARQTRQAAQASADATDRRIVEAFAAQAAVALRQERLAAEAAAARPLAEADRMRTALLAAVSHDLRTPLASAKAAVASLRSSDVDFDEHDRAELLATADESLDRLSRLVTNLLDMSRLQAGVLGVAATEVGAEEVVPRALDDLGDPGRTVNVQLPDHLPPMIADPGLLERVLVNVVGNALRYSPPGRPPVITGSALGRTIELRVIDHGPGIPVGRWDDTFQPFQRLGDRDNRTGIGLGLALSRGVVEAMGGTVIPEETPGGGLTMIVALPAAIPVSDSPPGAVPAPR